VLLVSEVPGGSLRHASKTTSLRSSAQPIASLDVTLSALKGRAFHPYRCCRPESRRSLLDRGHVPGRLGLDGRLPCPTAGTKEDQARRSNRHRRRTTGRVAPGNQLTETGIEGCPGGSREPPQRDTSSTTLCSGITENRWSRPPSPTRHPRQPDTIWSTDQASMRYSPRVTLSPQPSFPP
jgi:hypothetical protein